MYKALGSFPNSEKKVKKEEKNPVRKTLQLEQRRRDAYGIYRKKSVESMSISV
jgi:hypothetical protein